MIFKRGLTRFARETSPRDYRRNLRLSVYRVSLCEYEFEYISRRRESRSEIISIWNFHSERDVERDENASEATAFQSRARTEFGEILRVVRRIQALSDNRSKLARRNDNPLTLTGKVARFPLAPRSPVFAANICVRFPIANESNLVCSAVRSYDRPRCEN